MEGSLLGEYKFKGYKTEKDDDDEGSIDELVIVDYDPKKLKEIEPSVELAKTIVEGTNRVRDLVNAPSNMITPVHLAEYAMKLAKEMKIDIEVLGREEITKKGMSAICAVARGSKQEPVVIVMKYNGGGKETYGLIGKGITFDSGGISLKPSSKMSEMKTDMAGAATMIEVMKVISQLKLKVNVIAVMPCTENMPGGNAYKPGDVIGSLSGKTIEIISTDAEGRLIIADAITYAKQLGAQKLIDIATLTGGCIVALGNAAAGVMGNDDGLVGSSPEGGKSDRRKDLEASAL